MADRPNAGRLHRAALASALALAAVLATVGARAAEQRRPNFLIVCSDDQRWDALGIVQQEEGDRARFPWLRTPHMDRIAAEGVRFRNAFVTLPLCSPSRAVMLTGRYNHLNGVANNRTPFPSDGVTMASLLRDGGYRTAYIGKWHMGKQRGPRPGFDYSASFVGQGKYEDCPFEIDGVATPTEGWVDDVSTAYALDFIRGNRDRPFALMIGFKSPHGPRGAENLPARARDVYAGEQSRRVPNLAAPAAYRGMGEGQRARRAVLGETGGTESVPAHLDYMRHVSAIDDNVGQLLRSLDDLGLTDDTVVVFTSDNGYYLGEHGLGDKRSLYEESIRVPLLIRCPRFAPRGAVRDEMVLNIDLMPTVLGLAGIKPPADVQGRSWAPLLTGTATEWRSVFLCEYFAENAFETPTTVGVRSTTAALITYPGHDEWTELYDLVRDPYQTTNLIQDASSQELLAHLREQFAAQVRDTGYVVPAFADKPLPDGQPRPKKGRKAAGTATP